MNKKNLVLLLVTLLVVDYTFANMINIVSDSFRNEDFDSVISKPHEKLYKRTIKLPEPKIKKHLSSESKKYRETRDIFVADLMSKMSVQEKIGQMTQLDISTITIPGSILLNETQLSYFAKTYFVGSFLNTVTSGGVQGPYHFYNVSNWLSILQTIQQITIESSPNQIPMIYGLDSVHGANYVQGATLFPHNTGVAATFNPQYAHDVGRVAAKDTSAVGIPWVFAPVLGLGVQPLWSRMYETFGEDPYLVSLMGASAVQGIQGNNNTEDGYLSRPSAVCTAKHYFGYSDPVAGKDRTPAWIPERMLRRYFLPTFKAALDAGAGTIMINSGEVNGVPMHASHKYLTSVLRDELDFEGVAVTDWQDIEKLHYYHKIAASETEAVVMALDAGIDMSMVPLDVSFPNILLKLVQDGVIPESRLDKSVKRILNLKYSLGLFEQPYPEPSNQYLDTIGSLEDRETAANMVEESITLLQNTNSFLPLNPSNIKNILVTGPSSNSLRNQNGGWSIHWQGAVSDDEFPFGTTILSGIQQVLNETSAQVTYELGCEIGTPFNQSQIDASVQAASQADVVVLVIGELPEAEIPGDTNDLAMDPNEVALLTQLLATGTPVVLILVEPRPRILSPALVAQCSAVLMAYLPGSEGGKPIANILFGNVNPSGRLPFTYPSTTGDIGVYYYHKNANTNVTFPLFEFGHGLSYTTFDYTNIACNATMVSPNNYTAALGDYVTFAVDLQNNGTLPGKEAALLYLSDVYASITPEVKMLRGVQKVSLTPGESTTLEFSLSPYDFSFIGLDDKITMESGEFIITIGSQQISLYLE
ncbi:beta glucosidase [Tieghemostelium lacteum]|uniref:beta-glucosidase n=1 Tax=Tieghemostelium lacteum TaxID=361077 RepID=A0A152A5J2_TIELA|nr:beta glucosidase [Tieghemostelium lacteum]|eukprot:KYR01502.1 beta glucosidase [Tieghemostelium lacteum]